MVEKIEVVSSKGFEDLDEEDERSDEKRMREKDERLAGGISKGGDSDHLPLVASPVQQHSNTLKSKQQSMKKDRFLDAREKYKGNLFLVLEYVSHDLSGILDMGYRFTHVQSKCIFRQLLLVLNYMHENKYVHRDLKSSNILVSTTLYVL